jgi:hypothetical protein
MNEPRNVTPGWSEPGDNRESTPWSWDGRGRGRDIPWLGVLLVLVGIALLIQYFVPGISAGTLVLLAIAVAFLAGWLIGGAWLAMVPGLLVLGLGVAELIEDLRELVEAGEMPDVDLGYLAPALIGVGFQVATQLVEDASPDPAAAARFCTKLVLGGLRGLDVTR